MKYEIRFTGQFKKDLKLSEKQGKNTERLFSVIEKLANGETLDSQYHDHPLTGDYKGCRECHVEPDWLLVYQIFDNVLVLLLNRVGSHSELFKESVRSFLFAVIGNKEALSIELFLILRSLTLTTSENVNRKHSSTASGLQRHFS